MIIRYINSRGDEVNLNKEPYKLLISDLIDYEWKANEKSERIINFQKEIENRSLNIDIIKNGSTSSRKLMNDLSDIFEYDVINAVPGRLYIDDNYLTCFLSSSEKDNWETDAIIQCEYGLVTDYPFWVTEKMFSFGMQQSSTAGTFLDYPHDYNYDYASEGRNDYVSNDHFGSCDFVMNIFGPAINPEITIAGHIYEVITTLESSEYLQINSRDGTVVKVSQTGEMTNEYNNRNKTSSVFEKIPPGDSLVSWDGNFGFDITLFVERSEPKWIT